jgi:hypothetical protein
LKQLLPLNRQANLLMHRLKSRHRLKKLLRRNKPRNRKQKLSPKKKQKQNRIRTIFERMVTKMGHPLFVDNEKLL